MHLYDLNLNIQFFVYNIYILYDVPKEIWFTHKSAGEIKCTIYGNLVKFVLRISVNFI